MCHDAVVKNWREFLCVRIEPLTNVVSIVLLFPPGETNCGRQTTDRDLRAGPKK